MPKFLSFLRSSILDGIMGYAKELVVILKAADIPELQTSSAYKNFDASLSKMSNGYKQPRKNPFTDKLAAKGQKRAKTFSSVFLVIKGFISSDNPAIAEAANRLYVLFSQYTSEFSKTSYSGATGMISSFIDDLSKKENVEAIATLKLQEMVGQLLSDESGYEDIYLQAILSDKENEDNVVASKLRKEFMSETRDLLLTIGLKAKEDPAGKWADLNRKIAIHNAKFEKKEAVRQAALKKKREGKKKKE